MTEAQRDKITCWKLHNEEVAEAKVVPSQFGLRVHTLNHLWHHLLTHTIAWWLTRYSQSGSGLSQSSSPRYFIPISTGNEPGEVWLLNHTIYWVTSSVSLMIAHPQKTPREIPCSSCVSPDISGTALQQKRNILLRKILQSWIFPFLIPDKFC